MSGRPGDWGLLGYGSDPTPGDPGGIAEEASHYRGVASEIAAQVARLRRLADPDDALRGDYPGSLQHACAELADHVDRAHGRFETVAAQLAVLHPELSTAQRLTAAALADAEEAQRRQRAHEVSLADLTSTDDAVREAAQADVRAHDAASHALEAARSAARRATEHYDGVAERVASTIKAASHDKLKDGHFEGVKAWVKKHAAVLKEISKWLGRIAIVLAVAIVLLSNPAGWIVIAAALAAGALLVVDTLLAMAGEGSWTDVALDVVGVLTLGAGKLLGGVVKAGRSLTLLKAGHGEGVTAALSALRLAFNGTGRFARITGLAARFNPATYARAVRTYTTTLREVRAFALAEPELGRVLRFPFDRDVAQAALDLERIAARFGPGAISPVQRIGTTLLTRNAQIAFVDFSIDTLLDEGDNFHAPGLQQLAHLIKDPTTGELDPLW